MLTIIDQYKEKVNLATSHRQRLEDERTCEGIDSANGKGQKRREMGRGNGSSFAL